MHFITSSSCNNPSSFTMSKKSRLTHPTRPQMRKEVRKMPNKAATGSPTRGQQAPGGSRREPQEAQQDPRRFQQKQKAKPDNPPPKKKKKKKRQNSEHKPCTISMNPKPKPLRIPELISQCGLSAPHLGAFFCGLEVPESHGPCTAASRDPQL